MTQRELNSMPANGIFSHHQRRSKFHARFFRLDGKFWQRIFAATVLLSLVLFSPMGTIPAHAHAAPFLISPSTGSIITGVEAPPLGIPEFNWTPVAGATQYRLQISNNIGFTTTSLDITTSNTIYTPVTAKNLSDGVWYWRVRVELPRPAGDYSDIWNFTKQWATPANLPTLTPPRMEPRLISTMSRSFPGPR